jgi:transcriptional regulator with XRE-family HTH domain
MDTWASRIRDLQSVGKLKLSDIAEKIGVSTSSIGDIATGRTKSPRGDAALKLFELHKSLVPVRSKSKPIAAV